MAFLIVGLGNPGRSYQSTRHNVGFLALEHVAKAHRVTKTQRLCQAKVARLTLHGEIVYLAWPQTYVNRSGESVKPLVARLKLPLTRLMILCDDVALPLGAMRLRPKGSDGGHHGLASISEALGSQQFPRLRVGIGPVEPGADLVKYVLEPLTPQERTSLEPAFDHVTDALHLWLSQGLERAMSHCNR